MRESEQGSEVVQFALVVPLLLFLLFSIMQIGGMILSANQVSSEITRACRQLDVAGLQRAVDKEGFVKRGIMGASTQLKGEYLQVNDVRMRSENMSSSGAYEGAGAIEQRTATMKLSYDMSYEVPSFLAFPGLADRRFVRHVECSYVAGRAIEVSMGAAS